MVKMGIFSSITQKYRADLLLEILDSFLKTVSFLEIVLGEVRRGSKDVRNTGSTSRHKVRKCLGLRAAGPGLARNRRREPGISKLQLLAVFRQSCTEDFMIVYDSSILPRAYIPAPRGPQRAWIFCFQVWRSSLWDWE